MKNVIAALSSSVITSPPTRDQILGLDRASKLHFQGLLVNTTKYGVLPAFEACLAWLSPMDRLMWYMAKHNVGDTHAIIQLPFGPPLYAEYDNPYNPNNFPALDWTNGNTLISSNLTDLIQELILNGFNRIFLFLGGDGPGNYPIAAQQINLLAQNNLFYHQYYKYCVVIPGWDSVFYGWDPSQVAQLGAQFRSIWFDGYLGLEHDIGHIPLGEGGGDYLPGGRLQNYDLILSEFDYNLHQDSTWQILGRMIKPYNRPSDQPSSDDPNPPYYLRVPNPRGNWGYCAFEFGEYEFVRDSIVSVVEQNRNYLSTMGAWFTG